MKYLIYFNLLFLLGCAHSKPSLKTENQVSFLSEEQYKTLIPGGCYMSVRLDNDTIIGIDSQSYILEIINPVIEKYWSKITPGELAKYSPEVKSYQIRTKDAHLYFIFNYENLVVFTSAINQEGYAFCTPESPAQYRTVTREELLDKNTKIERYRIIGKPKIIKKKVDKMPEKLDDNQYYFRSGQWIALRRIMYGSSGSGPRISDYKKKLIVLGYDLEIDEKVDKAFKDAMIDFQRKNGLKEGNLDYKTIEALGMLR